jgi:hypothetical protein
VCSHAGIAPAPGAAGPAPPAPPAGGAAAAPHPPPPNAPRLLTDGQLKHRPFSVAELRVCLADRALCR